MPISKDNPEELNKDMRDNYDKPSIIRENQSLKAADVQSGEKDIVDQAEPELSFRKIEYIDARLGHYLRRKNPTYIVVHHSATKNTLTFDQIVAIEKERGLDPTYHCIITYDGTRHIYCRWDSVGYHVKRGPKISNSNSLGVCFVGNFSKDPNVAFNNADGRFGPHLPSDAQMQKGAELIALWQAIYNIPASHIEPHRNVLQRHTDCPGNNFPFNELVERATEVLNEWQIMPAFASYIREFRQKDFVFVDA